MSNLREIIAGWVEENGKEFLTAFIKSAAWLWYVILATIARISHRIMTGKKITFKQQLASIGLALFVGYISSRICEYTFPDRASIIVPVCTLGSDKIMEVLMSINWRRVVSKIVPLFKEPKED